MRYILYINDEPQTTYGLKPIEINELALIDDGSAIYILADKIIDAFKPEQRPIILGEIVRKIRYGGKLTITGLDLASITKAYNYGNIGFDEFMRTVYDRSSATSIEKMAEALQAAGLSPGRATHNNYEYLLDAERRL